MIINRTRISADLLEKLLTGTASAVGARFKGVVVFVSGSCGTGQRGSARKCSKVRVKGQWIPTDSGIVRIRIPTRSLYPSHEAAAKAAWEIHETALHEWAHIRDFQCGDLEGPVGWSHDTAKRVRGGIKRRCVWKKRPEEVRARLAVERAYCDKNLREVDCSMVEKLASQLMAVSRPRRVYEAFCPACARKATSHRRSAVACRSCCEKHGRPYQRFRFEWSEVMS